MIGPPDEACLQVSYAQSNCRAHRSIAKAVDRLGKATRENLSMQGIKKYPPGTPGGDRGASSRNNESHVFFRRVEEGPWEASAWRSPAGRSIATDQTIFPRGALLSSSPESPSSDRWGHPVRARFPRLVSGTRTRRSVSRARAAWIVLRTGPRGVEMRRVI